MARLTARAAFGRHSCDEGGFVLVIALGLMTVLSIAAVTAVDYSTSSARSAGFGQASNAAYALAEGGLNDAYAILNNPANSAVDPTLLHAPPAAPYTRTSSQGSATYYGTFDSTTSTWTVYSTGSVRNPTGAADVRRRLLATVHVSPDNLNPANAQAWNWIITRDTSDSTHCDETIDEASQIDTPLYVSGNLCLKKQSGVVQNVYVPPRLVNLVVKGKLAFVGDGTESVGADALHPIAEAHIAGGCTNAVDHAAHTCSPLTPTNDRIWALTLDSITPNVVAPDTDFTGAYANASPGPNHPCTVAAGTTPTFDNDSSLNLTTFPNGSVTTPFELTPSSSDYTCQTKDAAGNIVGELSWNHTSKLLTVRGTIFIDGSVTVSTATQVSYDGRATLYLSGTFSMVKNAQLCGVPLGSMCNFTSWNPNTEMLTIVTHGASGQNSVNLQEANYFQGALWAENNVNIGKNGTVQGPMIAGSIAFVKPVDVLPFPTITTVPVGAPTIPNTHAQPDAPVYGGG